MNEQEKLKVAVLEKSCASKEELARAVEEISSGVVVACFGETGDFLEYAGREFPRIVFIDTDAFGNSAIETAVSLQIIMPCVNIIFMTESGQFLPEAWKIHASGYIQKPVTEEKIQREFSHLRWPRNLKRPPKLQVRTFGMFEVFCDGVPVNFSYSKTKEMLAYLIVHNGAFCTKGRMMSILWEDEEDILRHRSYMNNLAADLINTLAALGCEDVLIRARGSLGINKARVSCDYYDWIDGVPTAKNAFHGEFMAQYSWAERILGWMLSVTG